MTAPAPLARSSDSWPTTSASRSVAQSSRFDFWRRGGAAAVWILALALSRISALGADWPTWRYDAGRSNASPHAIPRDLVRAWHVELPPPSPAWPDDPGKLGFDRAYEPIVVGGRLIVGSMTADHVAAYDVRTGTRLWRFVTSAPVRFAPAAAAGLVYFVCDDGYLYCLNLDGGLQWRVRGGPSDARALGNGRLGSLWPARGAPVIADGTVYFAASIWPFMGTFVHAVDARTGRTLWTNSGTGADYVTQQHSSPAFAGVAPQGYLATSGDRLIVPGGLTVPAVFSRTTGALQFFDPSSRVAGNSIGGFEVAVCRDWYFNRTEIYERTKGALHGRTGHDVVTPDGRIATVRRDELHVAWLPESGTKPVEPAGVLATLVGSKIPQLPFARQATVKLPRRFDQVGCVAGDLAYLAAADGAIAAVALPDSDGPARIEWQGEARGRIARVIAADDRLFVSTREGWIYCFAPRGAGNEGVQEEPLPPSERLPKLDDSGLAILVPRATDWTATVDGTAPPDEWFAAVFDDGAWKQVALALDEDNAGKSTAPKVKEGETPPPPPPEFTGYYRRSFTVRAESRYGDARLSITCPDRTSVWLDGRPLGRFDVRNGTPFNGGGANPRGPKWASHELDLEPTQLTAGRHVLAVQTPRIVAAQVGEAFLLELSAERPLESPADAAPTQLPPGEDDSPVARQWRELAEAGAPGCWCVVHGDADGRIVDTLARATTWNVVVLEPDATVAARLRERWLAADLLGRRVTVLEASWREAHLPPYLAHVVVDVSGAIDAPQLAALAQVLRPYGGLAVIRHGTADAPITVETLRAAVRGDEARGWDVRVDGDASLVRRSGALPDSADWTHQNGDAANTLMSRDRRVKLPLGILWFGGPSNAKILPRHGHGPVPQVVDGRLIIEGPDLLRAVDIYTGRLIWERKLKGLGIYYNNTAHHPGAGAIGGNYVSTSDGIYVAYGRQGLRLDGATGRTIGQFTLPADGAERLRKNAPVEGDAAAEKKSEPDEETEAAEAKDANAPPYWGHLAVVDDLLVATSTPTPPLSSSRFRPDSLRLDARYGEASRRLVAFDRRSGELRWKRDARLEFRHNAIVAGRVGERTRLFCLDAMTDARQALLKKRGVALAGPNELVALDAATGESLWRTEVDLPYTWLGYSIEHDVLLAAGSRFRDRATDEAGKGLTAYRGSTGERLWKNDVTYAGPCLLQGDRIITQGEAYELLTGKRLERRHPLTGENVPWEWQRNYGCNTAVGCPNLLTFRSAAAGFFDLETESGTGNFGGFRSSCTNNLIPAGGLLNAPDYTRTCTCSYQNQTSLALVHRPDVEYWTFDPLKWSGEPVERIGLNFGAPGDRRDEDGTLWMEFPSVGGRSPDVPVKVRPRGPAPKGSDAADPRVQYFRRHTTAVDDHPFDWVVASGVRGEADVEVTLALDPEETPREYVVRLYFAEVDDVAAGARTFDVRIQDRAALEKFDIVREAGGARRTVVKEFRGVEVRDKLEISLRGRAGSLPPQLNGVEIERHGAAPAPAGKP